MKAFKRYNRIVYECLQRAPDNHHALITFSRGNQKIAIRHYNFYSPTFHINLYGMVSEQTTVCKSLKLNTFLKPKGLSLASIKTMQERAKKLLVIQ